MRLSGKRGSFYWCAATDAIITKASATVVTATTTAATAWGAEFRATSEVIAQGRAVDAAWTYQAQAQGWRKYVHLLVLELMVVSQSIKKHL